MTKTNRRDLLRLGTASLAFPLLACFNLGCAKKNSTSKNQKSETDNSTTSEQKENDITMKIHYLEIVSPEAEALCKQYSAAHEITFSEPDMNLGNARTAKLNDGGMIGIRGPMRADETPVIRPYVLVEDLEKAVAAAEKAGAKVALPKMEIPGHGTIGIVIQGGIECGFWQV